MKNLILGLLGFLMIGYTLPVMAVSYADDFALPLVAGDKVYSSISGIDITKSFTENLKEIFYPPIGENDGGAIRNLIRYIGVGFLVIMIIWTGGMLIRGANDSEQTNSALKSVLYLVYGTVIFFGATWILGTVLNITDFSGLIEGEESFVNKAEEGFILQLIGFLKAFAFFIAIIMVVWYGSRLIFASGEEDKLSAAKTGLLNVVIALIFIKIIDYIYFIAQSGDFEGLAIETIVNVSKFLGFIFGIAIFLSFLYVGFVFLTSAGNDERITKAKTLIKNIVIVMLVVMLFLLIMYQMFSELEL